MSGKAQKTVDDMLKDRFGAKYADAMVKHFQRMVTKYQKKEWEDSNAIAGKFVEATLKAAWNETGEPVPKGKAFKVGGIIKSIENKSDLGKL